MKHYETLLIGHISIDTNIDCDGKTAVVPGGAVTYSSAVAFMLGHSVGAVTRIARKHSARLGELILPDADVYPIFGERSTEMSNTYLTPDKDRRISTCESQAEPFDAGDIPDGVDADIYHVAGLIYGDYTDAFLDDVAARPGKLALDVQCMLRRRNPDGSLYFEDWTDKLRRLPQIDLLKTDAAEAEILTGQDDRRTAAKMLFDWGAKEIMITHNDEVLIFDGTDFTTCPIVSRSLAGRTGRGDTTFGAYINERLTHSVPEALLTATAAVSLKMEKPGKFTATRDELDEYIALMYGSDPLSRVSVSDGR